MKTDDWIDLLKKHNPEPTKGIPGWVLNAFCECANQFKQPLPSTEGETFEQEAERLYPIKYEHSIGQRLINEEHKYKREAHIKARQMNDSKLKELIEWVEKEKIKRWNESHEFPDCNDILTKAKELLNQQP